jgi:hypothetical protein
MAEHLREKSTAGHSQGETIKVLGKGSQELPFHVTGFATGILEGSALSGLFALAK